jgi:hypothetical protein
MACERDPPIWVAPGMSSEPLRAIQIGTFWRGRSGRTLKRTCTHNEPSRCAVIRRPQRNPLTLHKALSWAAAPFQPGDTGILDGATPSWRRRAADRHRPQAFEADWLQRAPRRSLRPTHTGRLGLAALLQGPLSSIARPVGTCHGPAIPRRLAMPTERDAAPAGGWPI